MEVARGRKRLRRGAPTRSAAGGGTAGSQAASQVIDGDEGEREDAPSATQGGSWGAEGRWDDYMAGGGCDEEAELEELLMDDL
jgi:hypothetical protein